MFNESDLAVMGIAVAASIAESPWTPFLLWQGGVFVFATFCLFLLVLTMRRRRNRKKGGLMSPEERKMYVDDIIGEGVTDALEDAVFDGKISRDEATEAYQRLVVEAGLLCLAPQRLKRRFTLRAQNALCWVIRNRISKLRKQPQLKIPGDPPKPVSPPTKNTWWAEKAPRK